MSENITANAKTNIEVWEQIFLKIKNHNKDKNPFNDVFTSLVLNYFNNKIVMTSSMTSWQFWTH